MNPLGLLASPLLGGGTKRAILRDLSGQECGAGAGRSVRISSPEISDRLLDRLVGRLFPGSTRVIRKS